MPEERRGVRGTQLAHVRLEFCGPATSESLMEFGIDCQQQSCGQQSKELGEMDTQSLSGRR